MDKPEAIEGEIVNQPPPVQFTKTKHDEQVVELLEAAFHNAFNITEACQYAGISRTAFYEWLADDDVFSFRMSIAQAAPNKKAKEIVMRAIQAGDPNLALRYLTLRDPDFKPKLDTATDTANAEARNNLREVLDAIAKHDPSSQPSTADGQDSPRLVEGDPTDIS